MIAWSIEPSAVEHWSWSTRRCDYVIDYVPCPAWFDRILSEHASAELAEIQKETA